MNEFFKELGELLEKHAVEIDLLEKYGYSRSEIIGLSFVFKNDGYKEVDHPNSNLDVADCQLLAEKSK